MQIDWRTLGKSTRWGVWCGGAAQRHRWWELGVYVEPVSRNRGRATRSSIVRGPPATILAKTSVGNLPVDSGTNCRRDGRGGDWIRR